GLDRARMLGREPDLLHERNRERAGDGDVGDRGARDHADQRAGDDSGLARAALHDTPGDLPRLEEEVVDPDDTEERAEHDEEEYLVRRDRQEGAVDSGEPD